MFSGVLQVTDLNDFLGPSQACIKPTEIKKDDVKEDTTLRLDAGTGRYMEVSKDGEEKTLETASVSLNDCLACSGCITSAESVLITSQSHHDLLNALREKNVAGENGKATLKTVVVTLSPQSRASFAAKYNISPLTVHKKLASFFTGLGVDFVFDSSFGRDFSLLESAKEFVERFKRKRESNSEFSTELPMLASACPGWICYAEKTHSYLLPYISVVKSPQQVMGYLVKKYLAKQLKVTPDQVYHVTVMPCYDKKLEASRGDFYDDVFRTRDVDSVITTGELERLITESNKTVADLDEISLPEMFTKYRLNENGEPVLAGNEGTTSGGYTSYIFRYAAKELFDISLTADDVDNQTNGVSIQPGKNSDYSELILQRDNIELLRFAIANGFRNIQNIVRKIKPGDGKLAKPAARSARKSATAMSHFVEVMACPSGCINGGGQLKTEGALDKEGVALASKELTQRADRLYKSVGNGTGGVIEAPEENLAMMKLYSELGSDCFDGLRTVYHGIAKDESKFISGNW